MTAVAQARRMGPEEFLAWEARRERRWEFDGSAPSAMVGGTWAHGTIRANLVASLVSRLRGKPCRPCGSDVKVPIPTGQYRYPDALVTCTLPGMKERLVPEPVVIFEILSESTARVDRTVKLGEYLSIPGVRRYAMLEQDAAAITVVTPSESGWTLALLREGDVLAMPEIGVEIPVAELYADVAFEPEPEPEPVAE